MVKKAFLALCLLCLPTMLTAKSKKDIPQAPLPATMVKAKAVFLANSSGSDLAYNAFYDAMKQWGHYQLADSPDGADLVIELSYGVVNMGTRVWGGGGTVGAPGMVRSQQINDAKMSLAVYDAKTKTNLWTSVDEHKLAALKRNRDKDMIAAAEQLVGQLRAKIGSE
jgi:hypothetical protein